MGDLGEAKMSKLFHSHRQMDPALVELLKKFSKELDDVLGGIEIYDGLQADFSKAAQSQ